MNTTFATKIQLWVLSLLSLAACGPGRQTEPSAPLIYGGTPVVSGEFTAVVGLAFRHGADGPNSPYSIECTGTLITPTVVLTAGHCLRGDGLDLTAPDADLSQLRVYTGLGEEGGAVLATHAVQRAVVDPHLRAHPLGYADIGLVFLTDPIADVEPAALVKTLADQRAANSAAAATLVGYGYREDLGRGIKFQVETTLRDPTSHEVIAGGQGRDACTGDSGGPAFTPSPRRQLGIVSRGVSIGCGDGGYLSLVSDHICWIESQIGTKLLGPDVHCEWQAPPYLDEVPSGSDFTAMCLGRAGSPTAQETAQYIKLALDAKSCTATAAQLWNATTLKLDGLMIRDAAPLAGLTHLTSLSLLGNRLTDLTPLKHLSALTELNLVGNDVPSLDAFDTLSDLEAHGLTVLGKRRQLATFAATDFARACADTTLGDAPRQTVRAIFAVTMAEDCATANERLLSLTRLSLRNRNLSDLAPLAALEQITVLDLSGNPITDIAPLAQFESLRTLDLTNTGVTDLSPLAPLVARGLVITGAP